MTDFGKLVPKHVQQLTSYKPGKPVRAGSTRLVFAS